MQSNDYLDDLHICGDLSICPPFPSNEVFNHSVLESLSLFSDMIKAAVSRGFISDEYSYFSFWSRRKNLERLMAEAKSLSNQFKIGRGLILHITPANVRTNALFSLAFGLLAGNCNYLRISERQLSSTKALYSLMGEWLDKNKFANKLIRVGYYKHDSQFNNFININASARLIWGGDKTILSHRTYETKVDCIDLCFPNRTSYATIMPSRLSSMNNNEIQQNSYHFASDIYLFNQEACSSPKVIFIIGIKNMESILYIRKYFEALDNSAMFFCSPDRGCIDHLEASTQFSILEDFSVFFAGKYLLCYEINSLEQQNNFLRYNINGILAIQWVESIEQINLFLRNDVQTLVSLTWDSADISTIKSLLHETNISRVVKPGNSLLMDITWDGYDIIGMLSKHIPHPS